jgi:hypothetical protein
VYNRGGAEQLVGVYFGLRHSVGQIGWGQC